MMDYNGTFSLTIDKEKKKDLMWKNVKILVHSRENFYHFTHTHKHIHMVQA